MRGDTRRPFLLHSSRVPGRSSTSPQAARAPCRPLLRSPSHSQAGSLFCSVALYLFAATTSSVLVCRVCLFSLTHTDAPCCALVFSFPNSKNNYLN